MGGVPTGVIGCGSISAAYFKAAGTFEAIRMVACADLDPARARARADEFKIPRAVPVADLLKDPEIELVVNLTPPRAHAELTLAALAAGKHVYSEKPLAVTRAEGLRILGTRATGRRVGAAPDTFLGGGLQTCRALLDAGRIGQPVAAAAFMMSRGHEHWHPRPAYYYELGGGPMLDMGPYYLTALVSLLGPVRRVSGAAGKARTQRLITSQPLAGTMMPVRVPTHYATVLEFVQGAIGTLVLSFDCQASTLPFLEIYGTEATLSAPDPNRFGGPVRLGRLGGKEWLDQPLSHGFTDNSRGMGAADMACAIRTGRPHRASAELAFHVLDIMQAADEAASTGRRVELASTCERPAPLPVGAPFGAPDP